MSFIKGMQSDKSICFLTEPSDNFTKTTLHIKPKIEASTPSYFHKIRFQSIRISSLSQFCYSFPSLSRPKKSVSISNCHLVHLVYLGLFLSNLSILVHFGPFGPLWSNSIHLVNLIRFYPFDLFRSISVYFGSINLVYSVYFSSLRFIQFILVYLVHFWSISVHCHWVMLSFSLSEVSIASMI